MLREFMDSRFSDQSNQLPSSQIPKITILRADTLNEKYQRLLEVQSRIESILSKRDALPSDPLLDKRGELELDVSRHLCKGEVLADPLTDYCIRKFAGGTTYMHNNQLIRTPSAFDRIPEVKKFISYIIEMEGQQIMSASGRSFVERETIPVEKGEISGEPYFEVKGCFRNLMIPVKQLYYFEGGKWTKGRSQWNSSTDQEERVHNYFYVPDKIFSYQGKPFKEGVWWSDMTGIEYIGSPGGPLNDYVYVGNQNVKHALDGPQIKKSNE